MLWHLMELGFGYRHAYGGPFETKFPHSSCRCVITIDRDGTSIDVIHPDDTWETIAGARPEEDIELELVRALGRAMLVVEKYEGGA